MSDFERTGRGFVMATRGIYRIRNDSTQQHSVLVDYGPDYGNVKIEMPQAGYKTSGFEPPFDRLLWKADYDARSV